MRKFYERIIKRLGDFLFSLLLILLLSPVFAVVAILACAKLGRPVLFRQERPGRDGRIFTIYKFRTMTDDRSPDGEQLSDAQRLTAFGQFLRKTSLDELPELLNILKGDMSFVGPRPLLVKYLPLYSARQAHRHDVRPGLTGLAQVNGRNAISWEEKFEFDVYYVEHISFGLDVRIFAKTVKAVLSRQGISQEGEATMSTFTGKNA
jgi:lipopolysaccharide/colanic/teichoic acid biosynthesis glycosyltransferase